jgi:hypothetical protein
LLKASHSSSLSNDFRLFTAATLPLASPIGQAIPVRPSHRKGSAKQAALRWTPSKVPCSQIKLGEPLRPPLRV